MKFFRKCYTVFDRKTISNIKLVDYSVYEYFVEDEDFIHDFKNVTKNLTNFFLKKGLKSKYKKFLSFVAYNFNYFIVNNVNHINSNYQNISSIMSEMFFTKSYYSSAIEPTLRILEPPFVVKMVPVSKKAKKKTKKKFLIKIVYLKSEKRANSAAKQLHYYAETFEDSKFKVRLYKSFLLTFLNWNDSYLYKLKYSIFKKFLKNPNPVR